MIELSIDAMRDEIRSASRAARVASRWLSRMAVAAAICGFCAPASAGVDQWTPIGPRGGQILSVVTDPTAGTRLYATTEIDIFKSNDAGASWTRITPLQPPTLTCPFWPPVVQGDGSVYASNCHGLYKSADGGASWAQQNVLNANLSGDPTNPLVLYALASSEGVTTSLLKTTDAGTNWLPIPNNLPGNSIRQLLVDATLPSRLYALASDSVYRSLDSGVTWSVVNTGLPSVAFNSLALSGSAVFVATGGFGVYKTVNAGASWTAANTGIATQAITLLGVGNGPAPTLYAAVGNGSAVPFFKSADDGANWSPTGTLNARITDFTVSRQADAVLYAATQNGLATSANGGATWTLGVNNGLPNETVIALYVDTANASVIYAASGTAIRGHISTDRGGHWTPLALADGSPVQPLGVSPNHSGTVYGESCPPTPSPVCQIYRSVNFGVDWTQLFSAGLSSFFSILEAPDVPGLLFASGNRFDFSGNPFALILRSDDSGITWPSVTSGLPAAGLGAIAMDPSNSNVLYAGVGGHVYKTVNGGGIWVNASGGLPEARVNAVAVNPANAAAVFAGLGDYQTMSATYGLYRTNDGGTGWGPRSTAFVDLAITALTFDRSNPSNVYAGTSAGGLYRSTDGGANWRPINNGLTSATSLAVNAVAVDPVDGRNLYIGTNGGAFALTINAYDAFVSVIEFYNYNLDHYFIASELQADVPALDSGRFAGWIRTGQTFKVYPQPTMAAQPVCRFYIPPQHGDSHFYSASLAECAAVLDASTDPANPQYPNYVGYVYETTSAFYVDVPLSGQCPSNEVAVYRLWNQRIDSNHRYTTDAATRDAMIAKGYVLEGVVMCALQ